MAKEINEVNQLKGYLQGVIGRADHHAQHVKKVSLILVGLIIAHKDEEHPIKVMTRNGKTGNVLWVHIRGTRYAFVYNHNNLKIDIRKNSQRGAPVVSLDDNTNLNEVIELFATF